MKLIDPSYVASADYTRKQSADYCIRSSGESTTSSNDSGYLENGGDFVVKIEETQDTNNDDIVSDNRKRLRDIFIRCKWVYTHVNLRCWLVLCLAVVLEDISMKRQDSNLENVINLKYDTNWAINLKIAAISISFHREQSSIIFLPLVS